MQTSYFELFNAILLRKNEVLTTSFGGKPIVAYAKYSHVMNSASPL